MAALGDQQKALLRALGNWLAQDEEGKDVLVRIAHDPEAGAGVLDDWLVDRVDHAPSLVTNVFGGEVGKIVNIARAGVVILQEAARVANAPLRQLLRPVLERHVLFGGRSAELQQLRNSVLGQASGYVFVTGPPGFGKTALLANWVRLLEEEGQQAVYTFISRLDGIADEDFTFRNLCQQLAAYHDEAGLLPRTSRELSALYTRLLGKALPDEERLVIVLDGLDEASDWEPGPSLFPRELPRGVSVVFSAREIAERDWLARLELNRAGVEVLSLTALELVQIGQLLDSLGGLIPDWAREQASLAAMRDVSSGDPFYLHYLVEDICDGRIGSANKLREQPQGLERYLDGWWQQVSRRAHEPDVRDLLGYLLVAKAPLSRNDLTRISDSDELNGFGFESTLELVRRYVVGDENAGFSLTHSRFQSYVTESRIKEHEQRPFRERLLEYCARWREHRSPYALRHYAAHLLDAFRLQLEGGHLERLYALASDEGFLKAQESSFPDDPGLPLRTMQAALEAAAESDDAGGMAKFLLGHAWRVADIAQGSPLDALRRGSLERAWELADLQVPERSALWYLLLAWELDDRGEVEDARTTLRRLSAKQLPRGPFAEAAYLLALVPGASEEPFNALHTQLLDDSGRRDLCKHLITLGRRDAARETARQIGDDFWRAIALAEIGAAHGVAGERKAVRETFAAACETARHVEGKNQRAEALGEIAAAQAEAGELVDARETARQIEAISDQVLARIAAAQVQAGEFAAARETARQIEDGSQRAEALAKVAAAQVEAGEFAAARETAREMGYERDRAKGLAKIAAAQAQAGEFAAARETAREMEDERDRAEALAKIAAAQAEAGQGDGARQTFSVALKTARQIGAVSVRSEALEAIAATQAEAGEFASALETARQIRNEDDDRRAGALAKIAAAQLEAGEKGAARETFSVALKTARQIEYDSSRVMALAEVLQAIAAAQVQAGDFAAAYETAQRIEMDWKRAKALAAIAAAQTEAGERGTARETLAEVREVARKIKSGYGGALLAEIAAAQVQAGELAFALDTAREIENNSERDQALRAIAAAQAEAGELTKACETLREIWSDYTRDEELQAITPALVEARQGDAARQAFAAARKTARQNGTDYWRAKTLRAIAAAQTEARDFAAARKTAQRIEYDWQRAEALAEIAAAQAEAGLEEAARENFAAALGTASEIERPLDRTRALRRIATAQVDAGQRDAARKTLAKAREVAREIHYLHRDNELQTIAAAQAEAGDFASARETARRIAYDWQRALALAEIAAAQAEAGEFAAARKAAGKIEDDYRRAEALRAIAAAQAEAGLAESARETFAAALGTAWELERPIDRTLALRAIATAHAHAGEKGTAREIFGEARKMARRIDNDLLQESALAEIAAAQAEAGELAEACETARQIEHGYDRAKALQAIAAAQAQAGAVDSARETFAAALEAARRMENGSQRTWVLQAIAAAQAESGELAFALMTAREIWDEEGRAEALAQIAAAQVQAGEFAAARETARQVKGDYSRVPLAAIAAAQVQAGDFASALETAREIEDDDRRAGALAQIAVAQAQAGLGEDATQLAEEILADRNEHLSEIAIAIFEAGDREAFKRLLLPCSYYLKVAYRMCGLLARVYREQATTVADAVGPSENAVREHALPSRADGRSRWRRALRLLPSVLGQLRRLGAT